MSLSKKKNCARTTLATGISSSSGTMVVTDASKLPSSTDFIATIWNKTLYPDPCDDPGAEIVIVTNISGNTLTISRGQDNTSASAHASGHAVEQLITALMFDEIGTAIDAISASDDQNASEVPFTPNGDISATDVQNAIQEVRDDTDTKLSGKADTSHTHVEADITDLDKYTEAEIDAFFEGESSGKKQVSWSHVTDKPSLLTGDADDISTDASGVSVQDALDALNSGKADLSHSHVASDITDFDTEVSNNTDVSDNTSARHTHTNKTELDLITDGDHDVRTDNPHGVTADQVLTDVSGVTTQDALDSLDSGKADLSHNHVEADITDLDKYTQSEIDTFFEGESSGKKQVDWDRIINKPSLLTGDASDIGTNDSGISVQDALDALEASSHDHTKISVLSPYGTFVEYDTLQEAFDAVPEAIDSASVRNIWIVYVPQGTYDEELNINIFRRKIIVVALGPVNIGTFNNQYWGPSGTTRNITLTSSDHSGATSSIDSIRQSIAFVSLSLDQGTPTTHTAYLDSFRLSGNLIADDQPTDTGSSLHLSLQNFTVFGNIDFTSYEKGFVRLFADNLRVLGTTTGYTGPTYGFEIDYAQDSIFIGLVSLLRYARLSECKFEGGFTCATASFLAELQPYGFLNCFFDGTFTGPSGSFVLDATTNYWVNTNGVTLAGGATKVILSDTEYVIPTASEIDTDTSGVTVQDALDALDGGKADTSHTHVEADITDLDKYTEAEIDAFFEGEESGKKQVHWDKITNKPSLLTGDASDIGTDTSGVTVQDKLTELDELVGSTITQITVVNSIDNVLNNYNTIQEAFNSIPEATDSASRRQIWTVYIPAGTYDEDITAHTFRRTIRVICVGTVSLGTFDSSSWTPSGTLRNLVIDNSETTEVGGIDSIRNSIHFLSYYANTGTPTTHNAYREGLRISGDVTVIDDPSDAGANVAVHFTNGAIYGDFDATGHTKGHARLSATNSRFAGTVSGDQTSPYGFEIDLLDNCIFYSLISCWRYAQIRFSKFEAGFSCNSSAFLNELEPCGFFNCYFDGDFDGPVSSFRLDAVTNYWFDINTGSLTSGATKVLLHDDEYSIPFASEITTDTSGVTVQSALDTLDSGKADTVHTHVEADITDLDKYTEAEIDAFFEGESSGKKQVSWSHVTDKPTTFAPEAHNHGADEITFTPNGDISATDVQNAIQEVRDDTDTKLSGKADTSHVHDASVITTDVSGVTVQDKLDNLSSGSVIFIIDGQGSVISTGIKGDVQIPFDCTIQGVTLLADQSGSIQIDIWKDSYGNFAPTDADSITASAVPAISTAIKSTDTTLTGWTTSISAGDILRFNVDSATTITRCTLVLEFLKGS